MKLTKHIALLVFLCTCFVPAFAQVLEPSYWKFSLGKTTVRQGEETELIVNVTIDDTWYLYSSDFDPNLGPILTSFTFKPSPDWKAVGKLKPIGAHEHFDETWGGKVKTFKKKAQFRQKIKITGPNPIIEGSYEGQVCTEKDGKCVPVNGDFKLDNLKVIARAETPATASPVTGTFAEKTTNEPQIKPSETEKAALTSGTLPPDSATQNKGLADSGRLASVNPVTEPGHSFPDSISSESRSGSTSPAPYSESVWGFMLTAFLSGLVALLTPCVFPMIPMTVTFFTRKSNNRSESIKMASFYGLSIIAIYTLIGTLVARINGPEFANFLSTHWAPNLLFFGVFILFGLSFLGMFEIVLPSRWVNKVDSQADKGGYYGIFFMAFTLALVSFSCTGPIVGVILVQSAGGEIIKPIAGMFGFSLAFAIPFTLFAIFPGAMQSLPKSGGWLNSVKVVLGFLELALSLKFLSIADQAYHWHILDRDVFIAIWIVVFALIGFYLLGKIHLPHDSHLTHLSVPRVVLALLAFTFVVYLLPGMFGAPLKPLAGYLPPQSTIDFNLHQRSQAANTEPLSQNKLCQSKVKYADFLELPHELQGYFDYKQAMDCAKATGKPIFIDFTGHGCVNCREMEARVWSDPRVLKHLSEDFIMTALYVDDKTELPENEWYTAKDGKVKTSIGKQNADFQVTHFNRNSQPYYVILSPDGKMIAGMDYNLDVEAFIRFLEKGKQG